MVKYDAEFTFDVEGVSYRGIWIHGSDHAVDEVVKSEAPKKGWTLHRRLEGKALLTKPHPVPDAQTSERPAKVASTQVKQTIDEYLADAAKVFVPEGKVTCARCGWVNRSELMCGFVRCGNPETLARPFSRATWLSPIYAHECTRFRMEASREGPPRYASDAEFIEGRPVSLK